MSLNVKRGPTREPLRILLHGVEGVGKTTFASKFPGAIFIGSEDGGGDLDIARMPVATWKQAAERVNDLLTEPHDYRVLVIDSIDFLERLCWQSLMDDRKVTTIEDVGGGFGKGYTAATEEAGRFVKLLDTLRERRRMHIVAISHTEIKAFADPTAASYDRYQLRLHKGAAALYSGWADCILFANYEIKVRTESGGKGAEILKKGKAASGTPGRVLYTEHRAAFDAKNRYNLPAEMPLEWDDFAAAIRWEKRDAAILANVPAPPAPGVADVYAAIKNAVNNLEWTHDEVRDLLAKYGATDSKSVPENARAAVVAALHVNHTRPEAK